MQFHFNLFFTAYGLRVSSVGQQNWRATKKT